MSSSSIDDNELQLQQKLGVDKVMELTNDLGPEQLPNPRNTTVVETISKDHVSFKGRLHELSDEEIVDMVEDILRKRVKDKDNEALFLLGQLSYEQKNFHRAQLLFEQAVKEGDWQAKFQLGVILYDGLGEECDPKRGCDLLLEIVNDETPETKHLLRAAQFNIGRAYFQGFGVKQSYEDALKYFILAANDGNPHSSIKAQSTLGLFYSMREFKDLKKSYYWHSEACGNGSIQSQGAMGVMFLYGLGTKQDWDSAYLCLKEAANRGDVYAMGQLITFYYRRKLYTKTAELASKVALLEDVQEIAERTDCLPAYIAKGISLACFFYARCLHTGKGVRKDPEHAKTYYTRSYNFDSDICAKLQNLTQHGEI